MFEKAKRPSVDAFLATYPSDVQAVAQRLRALMKTAVGSVDEAVRPGWRLIGYRAQAGRRSAYFGYIAPHLDHVVLGFEYGGLLDDPDGLLRPIGRQVHGVRVGPGESIAPEPLLALIREAARVALLSKAEKVALQLVREARADRRR